MSTSDAGELDLGVGGGERATPLCGTAATTTVRAQQDKIFESFQQEDPDGDETPTGQDSGLATIRQEGAHKAVKPGIDQLRPEDSAVRIEKPRFTSSLLLTLSKNLSLNTPEAKVKKKPYCHLQSLTEPQSADTEDSSCQVNGITSLRNNAIETADTHISETILLPKKKKDVITVVCNEVETPRDPSINHSFSNGRCGLHTCNSSHRIPSSSLTGRNSSASVAEEDIKDFANLENCKDLDELSNPPLTMLSSTVVTVLAPHWSSRLRRTKRAEGSSTLESQGNLQDVTNTAENCSRMQCFKETPNQYCAERVLTDGSQALRVPFRDAKNKTAGWSSLSGPASLDSDCKKKIIQTVSWDVNSARMGNTNTDASNRVDTTAYPLSPLSLNINEQRQMAQTGHQGGLSVLSSKPTTSSTLLSLRRFNSNGRSSDTLSQSSLPSDHDRKLKLSSTQLSETFFNNNEKSNPVSPSFISYRTSETGSVLSPSSSSHRERNICENHFFSPSPRNKDAIDTLRTQQPQPISMNKSNFTCSKHSLFSEGLSERNRTNTNLLSESSVSLPRHSHCDHSALIKTHSLPRRTSLTSTSWWKQVTQDVNSSPKPTDKTGIKGKPHTPIAPLSGNYIDLASPSPTDSKRFISQICSNRENNNARESVCKGNMNLAMKTQVGTHNLKQRNPEVLPDHKSDSHGQQQYSSDSSNRDQQESYKFPSAMSSSKISTATVHTTLSHSKDLNQHDVNNSSFTENISKPPTLLNVKNLDTPTESSTKYNIHCLSKPSSIPTSPHNKDSEKYLTSKTTSCYPPSPNTKTVPPFQSHSVLSQTNMHISTHIGSSSQKTKFTDTANDTPLGFERSYASILKPLQPKKVTSLIPTVNEFSKTNCNPASTASILNGSQPAATTASIPSPTTPIVINSPVTISSILTPPETPVIASLNYSEMSSPKEGRTLSSSSDRDSKKEVKRARRVTWEDSVDLLHSEPISVEKLDPSQVPTDPLSPSRLPQNVRAPSIFTFLRSNSPNKNTSPLCSPTPKTSSIQVGNGGRFRSLSSDSANAKGQVRDTGMFDMGRRDFTTPRKERPQSVESGNPQCRSSAPLSLPPDFSSGYKLRYSSPPYSTLKSSKSTEGETKSLTPRSSLFQQTSQSVYTPHLSLHTDPVAVKTLSKPPINPPQPLSLPASFQNKPAKQDSLKCRISETDQFDNNHSKKTSQDEQNGKILLVQSRVHFSSESLQDEKAHNSSSTCVTETLVYSIKSKSDRNVVAPKKTTPKALQHSANTSLETRLSQQPHTIHRKEEGGKPLSHSDESSSGSSSTESQSWDEEGCNRKMKVGKSTFFSVERTNEQSPKKSLFSLKKSVSTPTPSLSRSDSERTNKSNNKVDQVINKLRQTFSNKRSDDDLFPWKRKRASQAPFVSESSDTTVESIKILKEREQEEEKVTKDKRTNEWEQNKYTIIPSPDEKSVTQDQFSVWSDRSTQVTGQEEQKDCAEHNSGSQTQVCVASPSPTGSQFDFYKDRLDHKPTNQFLFCRDPSPGRSPSPSGGYPAQFRKSTSSPRSPFSPFSSLSPLSPFSSPDVTDDSVFYSPKLQRHRETSSPCEPGEGINLGASRRSRASTGTPSGSPGKDKEGLSFSYADLKYGIEPGKSFSVSSVLSSRPSGPGRISTGSRFKSVGDLSQSALNNGRTSKDFDQWSPVHDCRPAGEYEELASTDPVKLRSRSLPRSLTRCLASWSSEVAQPVNTTGSKPACLRSPNMNTSYFVWDTEGPPTPPPTPPLSPVSRRMSQSSSPSTSIQHPVDSQSSRGHLPSRGYVSSLSTFEESSDNTSDTTTDDEYYLETGEDDEKETEL